MATFFLDPSLDTSPTGEPGFQVFNQETPSQWPFNTSNLDTIPRQQPQAATSLLGGHGTDLSALVANATEPFLEKNPFYMRLKMFAIEQKTACNNLQTILVTKERTISDLELQCNTFREVVNAFATDYKNSVSSGGLEPLSVLMAQLKPASPPKSRSENPMVVSWTKDEYLQSSKDSKNGETAGDSSNTRKKGKPGRPRKSSPGAGTSIHRYLEMSDGSPVDSATIVDLSQSCRRAWETLLERGLAPKSAGRFAKHAWDYYSRSILSEPKFEFLLLCDDGDWKLREWTQKNYSGWALLRGVRKKRAKKTSKNTLDDKGLYRIKPDGDTGNSDSASSDSSDTDGDDDDEANSDTNTNNDGDDNISEDESSHENPATKSATEPPVSRGPVFVDPFAPVPPPMASNPRRSTPSTHPNVPLNAPDAHNASVPQTSESATTAPMSLTQVTTTGNAAANTVPGSTPTVERPRARIKINPPRPPPSPPTTTSAQDSQPAAINSPNCGTEIPPSEPPPVNSRLNNAKATMNKKRKTNPPVAGSSKRTKVTTALAIPDGGNTIKNVCMRHWNEQRPGGQGLISEFNAYWKTLSDVDKEPFKKEMRIMQTAARKEKVAGKRPCQT